MKRGTTTQSSKFHSFALKTFLAWLVLLFYVNASAQVRRYEFEQVQGTYAEISDGNVLGTATGTEINAAGLYQQIYLVSGLPFSFRFNGVRYNQFYVHSTGYITFGSPPDDFNHLAISSIGGYAGAIQAWRSQNGFVNIGGRTSQLSWKVVGTAPNREIVVQWKNFRVQLSSSISIVPFMNYQIRLKETSDVVEIVYGESGLAAGTANSTTSAQVGLRGSTNTDFNNRTNGTDISINASIAGSASSDVQNHTSVNPLPGRHASGKIYRWTPPCSPSETPTEITGVTTICNGDSTTLTVAGGSLGTNAIAQWFTGDCGTNFIGTGNSITVRPSSNTTYFVWYNGDCNTTDCVAATVNISAGANAGVISGISELCENESSQLSTNGDAGGSWSSSNTDVVTVSANGLVNAISAGTATITYTVNGSGSCDDDQSSLNVNISSPQVWYADADGDGFGDEGSDSLSCKQPSGYVSNDDDCDDTKSTVNPNATEIPNNTVDEDCDGNDSTTVSVFENLSGNFILFPNPGREVIYINSRIVVDTPIGMSAFNATGQVIWQKQFPAGSRNFIISTTQWPAGIYSISIQDGSQTQVMKWIKTE